MNESNKIRTNTLKIIFIYLLGNLASDPRIDKIFMSRRH